MILFHIHLLSDHINQMMNIEYIELLDMPAHNMDLFLLHGLILVILFITIMRRWCLSSLITGKRNHHINHTIGIMHLLLCIPECSDYF